jgi:putative spermidine/putrescine transport system substrate-binding protein
MMIDRRKFLWLSGGIGGVALTALSGCQWANPFDRREKLRIMGLFGAVPAKSIERFQGTIAQKVEFKAENLPSQLWQGLQDFAKYRNAPLKDKDKLDSIPHVVSLADGWLDLAIATQDQQGQSLIQPITPAILSRVTQWQQLEPQWQKLVMREQQIWGVPYRWGATAIIYRRDKLKFAIQRWSDLWRPELKLKLILPDDLREVMGLVLKKLGQSYQQENISQIADYANFIQDLKALHGQTLTYNSETYLQSLLADDAIAAVGWTSDMYRARRLNPELQIVIPQEGTALWSDVWVMPQGISPDQQAIAAQWMDFCVSPTAAAQITALTDARSTSLLMEQVPASIKADPIKFIDPAILANSEVITPLTASTLTQYQGIWTKLRSGNL